MSSTRRRVPACDPRKAARDWNGCGSRRRERRARGHGDDRRGRPGRPLVVAGPARRPDAAKMRVRTRVSVRGGVRPATDWSPPRHLAKASKRVRRLMAAAHHAKPVSDGLPREEAREDSRSVSPAIFEKVIDGLKAAKALVGADRLALPTHKASVAGADDCGARRDHRGVSRRRPQAAGCRRDRVERESAAADRRER